MVQHRRYNLKKKNHKLKLSLVAEPHKDSVVKNYEKKNEIECPMKNR